MIFSKLSLSIMLDVFIFLKIDMISLTNAVSCSLFCRIDNLEVLMNLSTIGMVMVRST